MVLISTVLSLDHPFCQGVLGWLTIDVKDDVVGFDVPMDVVQIGVDVVNGLSIAKSLCQTPTILFRHWKFQPKKMKILPVKELENTRLRPNENNKGVVPRKKKKNRLLVPRWAPNVIQRRKKPPPQIMVSL